MSTIINIRKVALFVGLSYLLSWTLVIMFSAFGGSWNTPAAIMTAVIYMFMPMVAVIIVQKLIYKEHLIKPLGISFKVNRWFLVAWLLPPLMAFSAFGVSLLFPGVEYSPEMAGIFARMEAVLTPEQLEQMRTQTSSLPFHPVWLALIQGLIAGTTINAVAAFGEELGWRGFLQKELSPLGFWKSSFVTGFIWGIWHAPLILQGHNYPQHPKAGVLMMTVATLFLAPIFGYVRLKAGSVIAAAIAHGTFNACYGLSIMMIKGGNDLTAGLTGLAGLIVFGAINLIIFIYDRGLVKKPVVSD